MFSFPTNAQADNATHDSYSKFDFLANEPAQKPFSFGYETGINTEEDNTDDNVQQKVPDDQLQNISLDDTDEDYDDEYPPSEEEEPEQTTPVPTYSRIRRGSVSAECLTPTSTPYYPKTIIPKSASQRSRIETTIAPNFLFRHLDADQHTDVINAMEEIKTMAGQVVIKQGDTGDYFYIVESGKFDVFIDKSIVANPNLNGVQRQQQQQYSTQEIDDKDSEFGKHVNSYGPGGSFGELALMYNAPRAATVICVEDAVLWTLDRVTFRKLLIENMSRKPRLFEVLMEE